MPLRILIAEDDPAIALGLRGLLEKRFEVLEAADGELALTLILEKCPDVVLLDVNLPGRTGISVCQKAREKGSRSAIIMVSARIEQVDKINGLEAGADDYITKPFDSRELLARIEVQLRRLKTDTVDPSALGVASSTALGHHQVTIMFADLMGFQRLITQNETDAMAFLEKQTASIRQLANQYNGKIISTMGSAFLLTFDDPIDAVTCGSSMLHHLSPSGPERFDADSIPLRIGMHLGEAWLEERRASGEAVNLATCLQSMADPGSMFISDALYTTVKDRLDIPIVAMGEREVKGHTDSVEVYRIRPGTS